MITSSFRKVGNSVEEAVQACQGEKCCLVIDGNALSKAMEVRLLLYLLHLILEPFFLLIFAHTVLVNKYI